jgi:hypothetical protein
LLQWTPGAGTTSATPVGPCAAPSPWLVLDEPPPHADSVRAAMAAVVTRNETLVFSMRVSHGVGPPRKGLLGGQAESGLAPTTPRLRSSGGVRSTPPIRAPHANELGGKSVWCETAGDRHAYEPGRDRRCIGRPGRAWIRHRRQTDDDREEDEEDDRGADPKPQAAAGGMLEPGPRLGEVPRVAAQGLLSSYEQGFLSNTRYSPNG